MRVQVQVRWQSRLARDIFRLVCRCHGLELRVAPLRNGIYCLTLKTVVEAALRECLLGRVRFRLLVPRRFSACCCRLLSASLLRLMR